MAKCTYPDCDCAISFPEGYKPSEATECPRIRHHTAVERLKDKRRKRVLGIFNRDVLERLSTLKRPHMADRGALIFNIVANWDQDGVREEIDKMLGGLERATDV